MVEPDIMMNGRLCAGAEAVRSIAGGKLARPEGSESEPPLRRGDSFGAEAPTGASQARVHRLRYQEFFEYAPDCQLVTDMRGIILEANRATSALLGCRKEFLIDKPLGLFILAGSRTRFYDSLWRLPSAGADEFETRIGRRGQPRDVVMRVNISQEGSSRYVCRWLIQDITERRQIEAARGDLLKRLATIQEEERRRIARELHDEMGQHLTALILDLKLLGDAVTANERVRKHIVQARHAADRIGQLVHRLSSELRPAALDDLGLNVALRNHVSEWSRRSGIRADYRAFGPIDEPIAADIAIATYRIAQEALTNVAKHAQATRVSVILERRGRSLKLIVEDNGRGFHGETIWKTAARASRFGLIGMKERVTMSGGSLVIESDPGGPTAIHVEIPVPHDEAEANHG